ncbi:MAG: chemotaxis protein CheW [Oscillospiraceae bacterium]
MNNQNNKMKIDDLEGKYLSFYISGALYSVELYKILEIISIQPITYLPKMPHYIKGIINLRGKIIPVIDINLKFSNEQNIYDEKTCIIVVNIDNFQIGLIVDNVQEVINSSSVSISSIPDFSDINNNKYLDFIIKNENNVILNIDCSKLIGSSQLEDFN